MESGSAEMLVDDGVNIRITAVVTGETTSSSLSVIVQGAEDFTQYFCVADNGFDSVTSDAVDLNQAGKTPAISESRLTFKQVYMRHSNMNSQSTVEMFFSVLFLFFAISQYSRVWLSFTAVPTIVNAPETLTVVQPDDATFSCQAKDTPFRPAITWWRLASNDNDLVEIMMGDPGYSIEETAIGDHDLRSNLTILGTMPGDTGVYLCQAHNFINGATESAFLIVQGNFVW